MLDSACSNFGSRYRLVPGRYRRWEDLVQTAYLWNSYPKPNITGLQEVRWCDSGQVTVDDYTLIWSDVLENMPKYLEVGLALDKLATRALVSWHPINSIGF